MAGVCWGRAGIKKFLTVCCNCEISFIRESSLCVINLYFSCSKLSQRLQSEVKERNKALERLQSWIRTSSRYSSFLPGKKLFWLIVSRNNIWLQPTTKYKLTVLVESCFNIFLSLSTDFRQKKITKFTILRKHINSSKKNINNK